MCSKVSNADLRLAIARLVAQSGEGHIPSAFSIVDILDVLYGSILKYDISDSSSPDRDYFILSKGHGAAALFVVLQKYGLLPADELDRYGTVEGILGGHPDVTRVPHVEASTGSLGHGFPTATGVALGLKIQARNNRVVALLGDGECHEGTVWESANVAANQRLDRLVAIVDWNQSGAQLLPVDDLPARWAAFGWTVVEIDGHDPDAIRDSLMAPSTSGRPTCVIAHTVKGKGVSFVEGHGPWHHRVPTHAELDAIREELLDS